MFKSCFFLFPASFLEKGVDEKFWKKIQVFLSLNFINQVIWPSIPCSRSPKIAYLTTSNVSRIAFFTLWISFLDQHMGEKCWKKSLIFFLVASINGESYKISHRNHHKWKNKNETTKTPNWRTGEITSQRWYEKSADVGLFHVSPATRVCRSVCCDRNFFFVTQCTRKYTVLHEITGFKHLKTWMDRKFEAQCDV